MPEQRILFEKLGKSKYISHLDLLRTLQRAFMRAGISIRHSEGFNPHPKTSIALPLPVGQESICEILDFALTCDVGLSEIPLLMNEIMPEGISILEAYEASRKVSELKWVFVEGKMEYDSGVPQEAENRLSKFFSSSSIVISKRSKRGFSDFDIVPCIQKISFNRTDDHTVLIEAVITAQSPTLNPENLINAVSQLMPGLKPDFSSFIRKEIYDVNGNVFR
jgi:radical SAM-linked protein